MSCTLDQNTSASSYLDDHHSNGKVIIPDMHDNLDVITTRKGTRKNNRGGTAGRIPTVDSIQPTLPATDVDNDNDTHTKIDPIHSSYPVQSLQGKVRVEIQLFGYNNTWYYPDGFGTTYEITNEMGNITYYSGTLCAHGTGGSPCNIILSPGHYLWRVGGALDPHSSSVSWTVCHSHGGSQSSLLFAVDRDGHCTPLGVSLAADGFDYHGEGGLQSFNNERKSFLLQGAFEVHGLKYADLSMQEVSVLQSALAVEMSMVKFSHVVLDSAVNILSWESVENYVTSGSLGDVNSEHDGISSSEETIKENEVAANADLITFTLTIVPEDFGGYSGNTNSVLHTFQTVRDSLDAAMLTGSFVNHIVTAASANDLDNLLSVTSAKLVSLELVRDVEETYTMHHVVNAQWTVLSNVVIIVSIAAGIMFGVLHYRSTLKWRRNLTSSSSLDVSSTSTIDTINKKVDSLSTITTSRERAVDSFVVATSRNNNGNLAQSIPNVIPFNTIHQDASFTGIDNRSKIFV